MTGHSQLELAVGAAAGIVVLVGAMIGWYAWIRHRRSKVFRAFAAAHSGLHCRGGAGDEWIDGTFRDLRVAFYVLTEGASGESRTQTTVATASCPAPLPGGFEVAKQGVFASVVLALGGEDIRIGDQRFDDGVVIKCASAEEARLLLGAHSTRDALVSALEAEPALRVAGGTVYVRVPGVVTDPQRLGRLLDAVTAAAAALGDAARAVAGVVRGQPVQRAYRLRSGDYGRVFTAVMIPMPALAVLIPWIAFTRSTAWIAGFGAVVIVAAAVVLVVRTYPGKLELELTADLLRFRDDRRREHVIPLASLRWGLGPWVVQGRHCGRVLHLQHGAVQLTIGGRSSGAEPPHQAAAPVESCTGTLPGPEIASLISTLSAAVDRARREAALRPAG